MEVLRGRGRVDGLHVPLGAQLQVALDPRARVLRPLPLRAVRQEHPEARGLPPLVLCRGDELVHDDLRAVGEVAELRLPQDQGLGPLDAVAVVEPEHRELGEGAVDGLEGRLLRVEGRERRPGLARGRVVKDGVALREGSAAGVLAADADGRSLDQQRSEGERLGRAEVERQRALGHLRPARELLDHLRVEVESRRHRRQHAPDRGQRLARDARVHLHDRAAGSGGRGGLDPRPSRGVLGGRESAFVFGELPGLHLADLVLGHDAFPDQRPGVERAHSRVRLDRAVHDGLRVGRLVALDVPVPPEADQVDDDVLVELLAVVESDLENAVGGLRVVAVDVEDRHLDDLRDVGRVDGGTALRGRGREPDLVVDDDVDRAARPVTRELRQVQHLGDHPLSRERRVAVEDRRQLPGPARGPPARGTHLLGAHDALDHGIHRLQVRRVGFHLHGDLAAGLGLPDRPSALVVFDVALVGRKVRVHDALEARENALGGVADDVGENVEPPAVRHPDHDFLEAAGRRPFHQPVEQRDGRIAALDGVAPLPQELGAEEALELLGGDELGEEALAQRGRQRRGRGRGGDPLADPVLLVGAGDVPVLDADLAAVDAAHHGDDLAQRHAVAALQPARPELAVEIPDRQAVGLQVQLRVVNDRARPQRVDVGDQVPAHAVRLGQLDHARLFGDVLPVPVGGERVLVGLPLQRAEADGEVGEDRLVEAVLTEQQLLDPREEGARFGALDDPMVVGRGEHRDLRDRQTRQSRRRHGPELRRVLDRARRDDGALARHQARHRGRRPEGAGVGQRDGRALEVGELELSGPRASDDVVGCGNELGK